MSERFQFAHLADPQIPWRGTEGLVRSVGEINALQPAFVVVGGDMINNSGNSDDHDFGPDTAMAREYLDIMRGIDKKIAVYHVPGNHDICNQPTPETLQWFESTFGPCWYAFEYAAVQGIVVSSDLMKFPEKARQQADAQWRWLRDTLAHNSGHRYRFIFLHHPFCLTAMDEEDSYFNMPAPIRHELAGLCHDGGVTMAFSGHVHRNAITARGRLDMITTASCAVPLGDDPVGFRLVTVSADGVEHRYQRLTD